MGALSYVYVWKCVSLLPSPQGAVIDFLLAVMVLVLPVHMLPYVEQESMAYGRQILWCVFSLMSIEQCSVASCTQRQ